jgi:4-aminobutyrate aminotransferase-like enzyme
LEVIETEKLLEQVEGKGRLIETLLQHPKIKAVRRIGMLFAFDFENDEIVNRIVNYAKEHGVICYWFLSHPHSFRIAPPLTISEAEIRKACQVILQAIDHA